MKTEYARKAKENVPPTAITAMTQLSRSPPLLGINGVGDSVNEGDSLGPTEGASPGLFDGAVKGKTDGTVEIDGTILGDAVSRSHPHVLKANS
mmetsp:Transcript_16406/g.25504  ORF Transcript_16406/g.25504 Transcript_16406/m.25504 type:complete len:93 (-) Transcript_16406:477-755(-)